MQLRPWFRSAVPAMAAVFLATLTFVVFAQALRLREQTINDASSDMALLASAIAINIDAGVLKPSDGLNALLPLAVTGHGRQLIISRADGSIAAALPARTAEASTLNERLGPDQPLTTFGEKAGVLRIILPDGTDALAAVNNLKAPYGQVAVIHPLDRVLEGWRAVVFGWGSLFGAVILVLGAVAAAYVWQASRAQEAELVCVGLRERFDAALSRGRCGLWDWDLARGRIQWSNSMYEMLGMTPRAGALSFGEVNALLHPQDHDLAVMAEELAASKSHAIDQAFRIRNDKGDWIWVRTRVELVRATRPQDSDRVIGIAIDITDQVLMAERTATADMRLRDAVETISEAFVLWDADNRLVICNSKFQRLHNLPNEAVQNQARYDEVMGCATPPLVRTEIPVGNRPFAGARTYEACLSDGRWLQINERRTKDGGYVSVGTDITTLKRHEEQLLDSERRLMATVADLRRSRHKLEIQATQLTDLAGRYLEQKAEAETASRAKSEFLANMSHELRTPLNAIIGFAEMMEQQTFGALGCERYVDYCTHIRESGQALVGVIADVLDMSRLEAGRVTLDKAEFDIDQVVSRAAADVDETVREKGLTLVAEMNPLLRVVADRNAIQSVLFALVRNAVKFTPSGGKIAIRSRILEGSVRLYVEDTGVGIATDDLVRLGRPFEQINPPLQNGNKGSGLGLAIARSLVELHGGTLTLRSTLGSGTTVRVVLPNASIKGQDQDVRQAAVA